MASIETVIVLPLMLALFFGTIEGGILLHAHLSVQDMVGDGARAAVIARTAPDADWQILQEIDRNAAFLDAADIERVIIYHADSPEDAPPVACTVGPPVSNVALECSVYSSADLALPAASLVCGWCPVDRRGGEYIGVWVRYDYSTLTGAFPDSSITDQVINEIEPDL